MTCRYVLFAFTLCALATSYGQPPGDSLPIEERLATVESQLATLDTRLNARTTVGAGSLGSSESGLAAQIRIDALEREVGALSRAVRDLNRQVDTARREATEARREARDALSRIR